MRPLFYGSTHSRTNGKYCLGIFWSVLVGISWYLPYRYQWKTRSVQFGIKKGAIAPFFPLKGGSGPLFKELCPPFEEKRGERYKKGGMIPTEIPKAQQIWYQQNTDTKKSAVNTVVYNSSIFIVVSKQLIVCRHFLVRTMLDFVT
jgi:hypothetical protein